MIASFHLPVSFPFRRWVAGWVMMGCALGVGVSPVVADTLVFGGEGVVWKYWVGVGEPSVPVRAWREVGFGEAGWLSGGAPLFYSTSSVEPPFYAGGVVAGTRLSGVQNEVTCVYCRKSVEVVDPLLVSELILEAACDDGFVAWLNGVEVARYNVAEADPSATVVAGTSVDEPASVQAFRIRDTSMVRAGTNVLAVQVVNATLASSDLGFMASLTVPTDVTAPVVSRLDPSAGATVRQLSRVAVTFSEAVIGVGAGDLRLNGVPATSVTGAEAGPYVFSFSQPPRGPYSMSWWPGHGIADGSGNPLVGSAWGGVLDPDMVEEPPRISELMASNSSGLADEDGDRSDWLEIHNPRPTALALDGWHLTDDAANLAKWRLPNVTLEPGARLIVFASGKNRSVAGAPLHAGFSLSSAGEYLALVAPDEVTVVSAFAPSFPAQVRDRAYGIPDGGGPPAYLAAPTPGAANAPVLGAALVADTVFSPKRGLYDAPVTVTISSATPGASIRFTTDGSQPSATTGTLYTGPLTLTRTTVLRAIASKAGCVPTNVDTHTYLFVNDALTQSPANAAPPGWPSGSVNGQRLDYAMDPRIVNHANPSLGGTAAVRAGLLSLPSLSISLPQSDLTGAAAGIYVNAGQRGVAWERAASVELLNDPATGGGFKVNAGLRIRGNFSRDGNNPKHSFRLLFRSDYGDARLRYPLYGPEGAEEFDALDVQSPQDFSWAFYDPQLCNYMRDTWARDTQGAMGHPRARSRWLHLYLNGVYWGIYQIEERVEATFAASYLGGDDDTYDVIKNSGFADDFRIEATDGFLRGPAGQPSAWERMFAGCRGHFAAPSEAKYFALLGLTADGVTRVAGDDTVLLDPDNLADYLLMVMHSANTDMASSVWVGQKPNNFIGLRRRSGDRGFTWVAHDGETSLDYYSNTYDRTGPVTGAIRDEFQYSNPEFFHNDLLPSAEWRTKFGDRAHRALFNGGPLSPEACAARLDARATELAQAIIPESARWGDAQRASAPYTKADWLTRVAATRSWFTGRRENLVTQLKADGLYPTLAAPNFSQFGGSFATGTALALTAPAGTVLVTLDGTDPRRPLGAPAPSAVAYSAPIPLTRSTRVQARARQGTSWSALVDAAFVPAQNTSALRLSEIHYHPRQDSGTPGEDLEFLELHNTGSTAIDLGFMQFTRGLTFQFPGGSLLPPGAYAVIARSPAALAARHPGLTSYGPFEGRLDDSGETIELTTLMGERIVLLAYDDADPWPTLADGSGSSLTLDPAAADPTAPENWRASLLPGGTPGRGDEISREAWRAARFNPADLANPSLESSVWGDTADPDHDGFANALEYALGGTDPLSPADTPSLVTEFVAGTGAQPHLRFIAVENALDITLTVESSTSLTPESWSPVTTTPTIESLGNGTARITVPLSTEQHSRQFVRLVVRPR